VTSPVEHYLKKGNEYIPVEKAELICLKGMAEMPCKLCLKPDSIAIVDDCAKAITEGKNALKYCQVRALDNVTDMVIKINKTKWAFVDSNPGEVTEICPNTELNQTMKIPMLHSGTLSLNPECRYVMTNTPVTVEEIDDDLQIQIQNRNDLTYHVYNPVEDSLFKYHLKENSFNYFISFSTIIGTFFLFIIAYFCKIKIPRFIRFENQNRNNNLIRRRNRRIQNPSNSDPVGYGRAILQYIRDREGVEFIN
jgi:hypothetical protein